MTNFKYLTYEVKISMQSRNFMKNVYEELAHRLNKVSTTFLALEIFSIC